MCEDIKGYKFIDSHLTNMRIRATSMPRANTETLAFMFCVNKNLTFHVHR